MTFVDNGNGTATLSGTPAAGTGGTYPLTFTATNGVGARRHPELHADGQPGAGDHQRQQPRPSRSGTAGSFTVTTTGFPTADADARRGTLPAGVTFVTTATAPATLSRHAAAGTGGTYALTFTATNGVGTRRHPDLHADGQPGAGDHQRRASTTFTVGTAGSFTVTTTGFPTATLSESGTLPGA